MTVAEMEQRLLVLEQEVAQLKAQRAAEASSPAATSPPREEEEVMLPGVEYPVVLHKPPRKTIRLQGVFKGIRKRPADLGLSAADWASLGLEEGDDE